jgi:hypothetical protein
MLVMLGGRERTTEEYRRLLQETGFRLDRVIPMHLAVQRNRGDADLSAARTPGPGEFGGFRRVQMDYPSSLAFDVFVEITTGISHVAGSETAR